MYKLVNLSYNLKMLHAGTWCPREGRSTNWIFKWNARMSNGYADPVAKECLMSNVNLFFDYSNLDFLPPSLINAGLIDK